MSGTDEGAVAIELPSGKNQSTENFPVGSWLIAAPLRPHVHAFYRFARMADDVADAAELAPDDKLRRLDRMAAVLTGGGNGGGDAPAALAMRQSLSETGVSAVHCLELLEAFRQDAVKSRYASWDELMAYCRLSAAPVGRYLLDLHGEPKDGWPASDALCVALQVINHMQDCADDYRDINRVYIPGDWLAEQGVTVEMLANQVTGEGLRRVLDRMLERTAPLVEAAGRLPGHLGNSGLKAESAVIVALAERLLARLRRQDPLAERIKLGPVAAAAALATGLWRAWIGGRP